MTSVSPRLDITAPPLGTTPDTPDEPPTELLRRLDDNLREYFLRLWNTVHYHIRRIDFTLYAAGWDPSAIDALSATLREYANIFSSSKLDDGVCSLRYFEIKVTPERQPIQSRPYSLNPVFSKQADAILDSYIATGLIQYSTSLWSSPLVFRRNPAAFESQSTIKNWIRSLKLPILRYPASMRSSIPEAVARSFRCSTFFQGSLCKPSTTISLAVFCTPNGLYEWLRMPQGATGAPVWFVSVMRLVTSSLNNTRMHLNDAIGSDEPPINHVTTLATFFARLRLHKLKIFPNKTRIGAARVDFLGHVISQNGVHPNDDKVAALTRMSMLTDIKQFRSLLGLNYY